MTNIRNASLILKTSDFTSNLDYTYGGSYQNITNGKLSSITWNNINLRTLLGDMYDKYNTFNLCLNTISTSQANTIDPNPECKNVNLRLYGLPFINQTYSAKNNCNTNYTSIGTFNFVASGSTTQYYYSNNIATFGKNQEICNITIDYARIIDDKVPNSNLFGTAITGLTGTGSIGSNTITLSGSNAGIIYGSLVVAGSGLGYVTSISGTTMTISKPLTSALTATSLTITPPQTYPNVVFIFDIFGIPDDGQLPQRILY
jgi:hypothetical protein